MIGSMVQGRDGFEGLLSRHRDVIEAEVARAIRENEIRGLEREDLFQMCTIAAWHSQKRILAAKEPPALLRTVCVRVIKDHKKKLSRDLLATAVSLSIIKEP